MGGAGGGGGESSSHPSHTPALSTDHVAIRVGSSSNTCTFSAQFQHLKKLFHVYKLVIRLIIFFISVHFARAAYDSNLNAHLD